GSPDDVPPAIENGAEGVGLLRTEFLFLERDSMPSEDEQFAAYKNVAEALEGRPLILRTLDVGADKPLPYLALRPEANPFLGVRGIRLAPEGVRFSRGTSGLVQYTMAAERGHASVAGLADGLHPSVLRLIRTVAEAASGHGKWAGVCGELASDPTAVPLLVGLGIAELSANAPAIPAVKQAVGAVDNEAARELAEHALELSSAAEVRQIVAAQ